MKGEVFLCLGKGLSLGRKSEEFRMDEELAKLWEGFSLTDQERQELVLPTYALNESISTRKFCLLAPVDKVVNREAFRTTMAKVWRPDGWIQFNKVGENKYMLEFQTEHDKENVMLGRPDPSTGCLDISFSKEHFWVQLHNMPLACMTKEIE